jgi:hypothetical protein
LRFETRPIEAELASFAEEIRPDLTLLERADENAFGPAPAAAPQVRLAHRQGQGAQVIASERQNVEGSYKD